MTDKELYKKLSEEEKYGLPLFLKPWWLDVVCRKWDVVIAKKGEQVTGVWPYPVEKKASVNIIRTPMLTPYLAPHVFPPADTKKSNLDSFEHETITGLMKQLPDAKVWHLAMQPGMKQAALFKGHELDLHVQQTFLVGLGEDEDTLFSNMKENMRRNIRKAEKEITISDAPECLETLYKFQNNTLQKKGKTPVYSLADLQKIMDACISHQSSALWVARIKDSIQAIVWHVWDARCSYYLMGGQNPESGSHGAMTLLLWHAMKDAKQKGHQVFDLEGSMDEGVERFFMGFGGQRELYLVVTKNESLLWKVKEMVMR